MTMRRIRCLLCNELVYPIPTLQSSFSTKTIRVANKMGCICSQCVFDLYDENADIYEEKSEMMLEEAQKATTKEKASSTKHSTMKYTISFDDKNGITEGFTDYPCLNVPMNGIIEYLKSKIRGQDEALTKMVYTLYHNQMCNMLSDGGFDTPKHEHILLMGSTGVGKTYITETVLNAMHIPYSRFTAEAITSAGYIGGKVEDIIEGLYAAADFDLEKAQKGVIVIDEIDKKRRNFCDSHDVNGLAVQQELLKILEPSVVWIRDRKSFNPHNRDLAFDTSKLTVVLCGAFVGMEEVIERRVCKREIGFSTKEIVPIDLLANIEPKDFVEYGFIEEFVGRMPTPTVLKPLDKSTILDIIYDELESQNSLFKTMDFELSVSDAVLNTIADRVLAHKTGARDVKKELENLLYNAKRILLESAPSGICTINEHGDTEVLKKDGKKTEILHFKGAEHLKYTDT